MSKQTTNLEDMEPATGDTSLTNQPAPVKYHLPTASIFTGLLIASYLLLISEPSLAATYPLPEWMTRLESRLLFFALAGLIWLRDLRLTMQSRHQVQAQYKAYQDQLEYAWQRKKQQQQRAHTYSSHAEKLKSFINDRLLEFMEYDEKFVHFKGIAAEVRHNGVISYDKVITALNKAIEQQHFLSMYEARSVETDGDDAQVAESDLESDRRLANTALAAQNPHSVDSLADYQSAIDAMRYLWDLLDLSTADNMAMHISNHLIKCEEHYYQLQLDSEVSLQTTQSIPVSPTFYPQLAVLNSLCMFCEDPEIKKLIALAKINPQVLEQTVRFENNQFTVCLCFTPELLGNPNHLVLLIENLIKNAQFFHNKREIRQTSDRILINLHPVDGHAHLSVYNRGPLIEAEQQEQIFKLGYSTRRTRKHHGKGLGLFFTREIIRGYQGEISPRNWQNSAQNYLLEWQMENGDSQSHHLRVGSQEKLQVALAESDEWLDSLEFPCHSPVTGIRLSLLNENTQSSLANSWEFEDIDKEHSHSIIEPPGLQPPRWQLHMNRFRKQQILKFMPLDVTGVSFEVSLPLASQLLEESEEALVSEQHDLPGE